MAQPREPGALAYLHPRQGGWQSHGQSLGIRGPCRPRKAHHGWHREQPLGCEHPGDRQRRAGRHVRPTLVHAQSWCQAEGLDRQLNGAGGCWEKEWCLRQALLPGRGRGLRLSQATLMATHKDPAGNWSSGGSRGSLRGGQGAVQDWQGRSPLVLA